MTAPADDASADLHAVIAELRAERDAAVVREAKRDSDYAERAAHQGATVEVLQAMAASPGDPKPVFEVIVRRARDLCDGYGASLAQVVDSSIVLRAYIVADEALGKRHEAGFPRPVAADTIFGRAILARAPVQIPDVAADETFALRKSTLRSAVRALVAVPLMRNGEAIGAIDISRRQTGEFSPAQIELLQVLANQAVIAINSAEMYRALQARTSELQETLEYQTATSEVLNVISRSTFDLQPVLSTVAETAARLCVADQAALVRHEGGMLYLAANWGFPPEYEARMIEIGSLPVGADALTVSHRAIIERRIIHIPDVAAVPGYPDPPIRLGRQRTSLGVPLLREGEPVGLILLARQRVEPFTDRQIDLVRTFADQAVIAIENTRLITEQREALERQTATAEVLQVINANPGNLVPVFDAILEKAHSLCGAAIGSLMLYDGTVLRAVATRGYPGHYAALVREPFPPGTTHQALIRGDRLLHVPDMQAVAQAPGVEARLRLLTELGLRTGLFVPLHKDGVLLGIISAARLEVRPFSDKEIALLENFAAQAVIAMENARLLDEVRQRQEELRITFENMGDGVAMFDETQHLVAWNRKFQDILGVPDDVIERRQSFAEYLRYLAERGEYGPGTDPEEHVRRLIEQAGQSRTYERTRLDGRVIEIRHNPVPGGGFVLIYADITERKRNEAEIRASRDAAEEASRTIEAAFRELKIAQANLIQAEKMASLGQLTAGIAHEIKNPLNFVNNFAELSVDLLGELKDAIAPAEATLTEKQRAEVEEVSVMLTSNLEKITEHGKRADGIVKAMLEHSRGSSGERRMVDLNALIDEALNLAYHGARAQDQSFNITLERDFGDGIAPIEVNPQDITRVFLNIFSNGFYAATRRAREGGVAAFVPTLKVTTRDASEAVEIRVRDNGTGISADIRDKLFQPFFTTKPTGEGTGLGLSITYDIVTQQHGGSITVDSEVCEYSEFTIRLPRNP